MTIKPWTNCLAYLLSLSPLKYIFFLQEIKTVKKRGGKKPPENEYTAKTETELRHSSKPIYLAQSLHLPRPKLKFGQKGKQQDTGKLSCTPPTLLWCWTRNVPFGILQIGGSLKNPRGGSSCKFSKNWPIAFQTGEAGGSEASDLSGWVSSCWPPAPHPKGGGGGGGLEVQSLKRAFGLSPSNRSPTQTQFRPKATNPNHCMNSPMRARIIETIHPSHSRPTIASPLIISLFRDEPLKLSNSEKPKLGKVCVYFFDGRERA